MSLSTDLDPESIDPETWKGDWTERAKTRGEKITEIVYTFALISFAIGGFLPIALIVIIGFFSGTIPSSADGGIWGFAEGYPAFDPQTWLLLLPAAAMLFLAFWTIPSAVRGFHVASRSTWMGTAFAMAMLAITISIAFDGAPGIGGAGVLAPLVFAAAWVLFVLRALAGALHLVPRKWREDTTLIPKVPKKRRRTSPNLSN